MSIVFIGVAPHPMKGGYAVVRGGRSCPIIGGPVEMVTGFAWFGSLKLKMRGDTIFGARSKEECGCYGKI